MKPLLLLAALALPACSFTTVEHRGPELPLAPAGTPVRSEVAAGYAAFAQELAAWGTWTPDTTYGVRWCPRAEVAGAGFQPYRSGGHWGVTDAPIGSAPLGTPLWRSDEAGSWRDLTTHRGWWISRDDAPAAWCWVPGVEESAGNVVWRAGDGFVGWAPEPPYWVAWDDEAEEALPWTYTLLGMLLELGLDAARLTGEAIEAARDATQRGAHQPSRRRVGPTLPRIAAAKDALIRYGQTHAAVLSTAPGLSREEAGPRAPTSNALLGASKSESSKETKVTVTFGLLPGPMPSAMAYYRAFQADPQVAPGGVVSLGTLYPDGHTEPSPWVGRSGRSADELARSALESSRDDRFAGAVPEGSSASSSTSSHAAAATPSHTASHASSSSSSHASHSSSSHSSSSSSHSSSSSASSSHRR
jgi:hypothetical protein